MNYSRQYENSPQFRWANSGTITVGSYINVSWETEDTTSKKYLPFNLTRIINNASADIIFYPNQNTDSGITVPAGTILTIDRITLPALSTFQIKNSDSSTSITAGQIIVTNSREGQNADSVVQRLHQRLFGQTNKRVV